MLTYDEMIEKTREFYDELQIDIPDKYVDLAVRSLTMPQYSKEFNDKFHKEIGDHRALATVGDALSALLIEGRNNQISIHKNFENKMQEIRNFETENKDTLHNLKAARDKLYAHIDLDWQKYAKSITFDEFECCIKFLNDLFDYRVFD